MLNWIKKIFGAASSSPNSANAPHSPERRSAANQGVARTPERRVAVIPELIIDKPPVPEVDEGNTEADWSRWQDSVMALEGTDPKSETAPRPPMPYERRKEPRNADTGLDSVRVRD